MIEKLQTQISDSVCYPPGSFAIVEKINEIIDFLNRNEGGLATDIAPRVEDNTVNVEMVTDPKTGEKYPFVSYKEQLQARELSVEDKQLVLKDISARVPYKVKFQNENIPTPNVATLDMTYLRMFEIREGVIFKPYLRPMSSMTEAEKDEEFKMCSLNCSEWEMADFFNKHHLDYHGLIEKGLAIAVTEENNPYK